MEDKNDIGMMGEYGLVWEGEVDTSMEGGKMEVGQEKGEKCQTICSRVQGLVLEAMHFPVVNPLS